MHFIDWKVCGSNWAIQRKQFLKRGNCAQKEKSILMAMWNPWSHRVPTRLHPICPQTLLAFCLLNKTLPTDPYRGLSMSYPKYKRSCQTQLFVSIPLLPGPPFRVFSPPGYPFLPKSPFQVFDLPGVQFFILSLIFARTSLFFFLVRRDAPFLPGLFFLLSSGSILCEVFFNRVWVNRGRESFALHGC